MVDFDSFAMYLGYGTMAGTLGAVVAACAYKKYPEKSTQLLISGVAKCGTVYESVKNTYEAEIAPLLTAYKDGLDLIFKSKEPTRRVFLIKNSKTAVSFPSVESAKEAEVVDDAYDMAMYCFNDEYPVNTVRRDYVSELNDDFRISTYRFLNVTLYIGNDTYTLNLEKPSMFYISDNIILDHVFIDWICRQRLGLDGVPDDYKVTIIDAEAEQHTLVSGDAIKITDDGYTLLESEKKKEANEATNPAEAVPKEDDTKDKADEDKAKNRGRWWPWSGST